MTTEQEIQIAKQILDQCKARGVTPLAIMLKNRIHPQALSYLWKPSFTVNAVTVQSARPRQVIEFLRIGRAVVGDSANKWVSSAVGQYRWWTVRLLD
jgi:hypothetical protein